MSFNVKDLDKISHLARITLSNEQKESFTKELDKIIAFIGNLDEVDITKVEPLYSVLECSLSLKTDLPKSSLPTKALQTSAGYEDGLIRVPKIIE